MFKTPTMTAIGLAMGLTLGAAGAAAQNQSPSQSAQGASQGQQAQQQSQGERQQSQRQQQGRTAEGERAGMPVLVIFVDRDRDMMVSRDEARQAREDLFLVLDTDEDEQLSRDEFGGGMTREQTARYFGEGDVNRDERLSAREYLDAGERRYREQAQQQPGRQARQALTIEEYGESAGITEEEAGLADVDRDEMIAPDEAAYDTARRFRRLDQDDDGFVSHAELRQSEMELQRDREFSALDENSDDRLSREEFTAPAEEGEAETSSFDYRAGEEERRRGGGQDSGMGTTRSNVGGPMQGEGSDDADGGSGSSDGSN